MGSDLSDLAPANGTNAIVSAAFAIELDSGDPTIVAGFGALVPQMTQDGYEPPQPQMMFQVSMNISPAGTVSGGNQELGGYTYFRKNTAGQPVRDFSLRGNTISVVVHEYTRWQPIWGEVQKLFERCTPFLAGSTKNVRSIALQYIDKFTWRQTDVPFPTKKVLRAGSPHFAPLSLELSSAWHNQFGLQLDLPNDPWAAHRLENVNLSIAPEGGYSALTILTIYRYFARNSGKAPQDFVTSVLSKTFAQAHDDNKQLLREILTEKVCDMIDLNK